MEKKTLQIGTIVLFCIVPFILGCASSPGTEMDPYYAIGKDSLEKIQVSTIADGSGMVSIGKVIPFIPNSNPRFTPSARPKVPPSPVEPQMPQAPRPPDRASGGVAGGEPSPYGKTDGQYISEMLLYLDSQEQDRQQRNAYNQGEIERYRTQTAEYQREMANYPNLQAKYRQDIAIYNQNLPQYQAKVEAEIKAITNSINPEAPLTWYGYIEGQYLLYHIRGLDPFAK